MLTRASLKSNALKIVSGYSRSEETRATFAREFGVAVTPDLATLLADPAIKGVILTVPNEQHLSVAREVAKAGKHVYTEKPIASTLTDGLEIEALEKTYGVSVTVGHSARLMAGIRKIREAIDAGELGRVAFIEANFSNERALELTPKAWRWYKDRAPGGPLSQLAIHQFDVLHYLGGEMLEVSAMSSKLSPVGAEVDDQSMTLVKFTDGKVGYVGSCWTSPGVFAVRVFGAKGLMHYEIDFGTWDTPHLLHETSTLYIQRGRDGYGKRQNHRGAGKRHVPRRTRNVRAKLSQPAQQRTLGPQWLRRGCGGLCGAALARPERPRGADRRGDRERPRAACPGGSPCCLAATSGTSPSRRSPRTSENPLVILPAGSVEQHGPHLPTGTDTFAANVIAHAVAERMDGLVLPARRSASRRCTCHSRER